MARTGKTEIMELRIIAGHLRSRKIQFRCDQRTRPMKDRTREAVMNLLGGTFPGAYAFDLFGGSGILALEAISRGASKAFVWEILRARAADISRFSTELGVGDQVAVLSGDCLHWTLAGGLGNLDWLSKRDAPWVLFACPPYRLWENEGESIRKTLQAWLDAAPPASLFAVELEVETDEAWLPQGVAWDLRRYPPAKIAIAQTGTSCPNPQAFPA